MSCESSQGYRDLATVEFDVNSAKGDDIAVFQNCYYRPGWEPF